MPKFDKDTQPAKRGKGPKPGAGGGPPKLLQDYRWVAEHQHDATEDSTRRLLQDVRTDNPNKFLDQWHQLERAYKGDKGQGSPGSSPGAGSVVESWDGTGPCPTCRREPDPYAGMTPEALEELLEKEFEMVEAFDAQRRVPAPGGPT